MKVTSVLVSEGTSDICIQRIASLLVTEIEPAIVLEFKPDNGVPISHPPGGLSARLKNAVDLYSPNLLFIHRDADTAGLTARRIEIEKALQVKGILNASQAVIAIPKREIEAWLLADETAILKALGTIKLGSSYPKLKQIEQIDAKATLKKVVEESLVLAGYRPKDIRFPQARFRIGQNLGDLARLRKLSAFQAFEENLQNAIHTLTS